MDVQAKKILDTVWCETATSSRATPESVGIDRSEGWSIEYEQDKYPERKVWNRLLWEIQEVLRAKMRHGILPWQPDLDYPIHSFVQYNRQLYHSTATIAAGGEDPETHAQWRRY